MGGADEQCCLAPEHGDRPYQIQIAGSGGRDEQDLAEEREAVPEMRNVGLATSNYSAFVVPLNQGVVSAENYDRQSPVPLNI